MDRLDKMAISILAVLACYAAALMILGGNNPQPASMENKSFRPDMAYSNPVLDHSLKQARKLLDDNNLGKTEKLVNELINTYPYEGQPYMIRGDLYMHLQKPIKAMYAYKAAVDLNPDFLDKNTKLFQGKKIKVGIEEAKSTIEAGLQKKPDDPLLRKDLKILYYMQRKLAGSCG